MRDLASRGGGAVAKGPRPARYASVRIGGKGGIEAGLHGRGIAIGLHGEPRNRRHVFRHGLRILDSDPQKHGGGVAGTVENRDQDPERAGPGRCALDRITRLGKTVAQTRNMISDIRVRRGHDHIIKCQTEGFAHDSTGLGRAGQETQGAWFVGRGRGRSIAERFGDRDRGGHAGHIAVRHFKGGRRTEKVFRVRHLERPVFGSLEHVVQGRKTLLDRAKGRERGEPQAVITALIRCRGGLGHH